MRLDEADRVIGICWIALVSVASVALIIASGYVMAGETGSVYGWFLTGALLATILSGIWYGRARGR